MTSGVWEGPPWPEPFSIVDITQGSRDGTRSHTQDPHTQDSHSQAGRHRLLRQGSRWPSNLPHLPDVYSRGFSSPSMVGISSETVGWMCTAR